MSPTFQCERARRATRMLTALLVGIGVPWGTSSAQSLGFDAFYRQVRAQHPIARQAQLTAEIAAADLRGALGAFEPVLSVGWDNKTFGGKSYYDEYAFKLTVPTSVGMDVKLGFDRAGGSNLNPESTVPKNGLWSAGVSIPLGQRTLTDERRTALAQSRAARDGADGERAAALNKLLLSAAKDWAAWSEAERKAAIARDGVGLAEFRLSAVRTRVRNGDAAAIDTVEAGLEVDRRTVARLDAEAAAVSARLVVNSYLWSAAGTPQDLGAEVRPEEPAVSSLVADSLAEQRWIAAAERSHPELAKLTAKLRQSEAQRLLARQSVLPLASVDLAALGVGDPSAIGFTGSDLKAGASAKLSPLLIKDRAKLAAATAKLERDRLELQRTQRDVALAVREAANQYRAIEAQRERQARAVTQARLLRDAEQRRLDTGESSLLVVNLRERALLDEQVKLAALDAKRLSTRAALGVAIGAPAIVGF